VQGAARRDLRPGAEPPGPAHHPRDSQRRRRRDGAWIKVLVHGTSISGRTDTFGLRASEVDGLAVRGWRGKPGAPATPNAASDSTRGLVRRASIRAQEPHQTSLRRTYT
jgi:hypothetical protein